MTAHSLPRVMWLLNHGSARRFEVAMLKRIGVTEIFLPKRFPVDPSFRSASVDYSEDANLTIPADAIAVLNEADWYRDPGREAWDVANRYFDVMFFILHHPEFIHGIAKRYRGIALWRTYGLQQDMSYTQILQTTMNRSGEPSIRALGNRFFFAQAYEHLHTAESDLLADRRLFLPLGLDNCTLRDEWRGNDARIFFVCPGIGLNPYYKAVYRKFTEDFRGLPFAVAGEQPISVDDPRVLGFVDRAAHERNMREMRVMFYHSSEPRHVHYHPFEAVRAGMPLVFMAGGLLDRMGGSDLPGRCTSIGEARRKIERILDDDRKLIAHIRGSQVRLLDRMRPDACVDAWRTGFGQITKNLHAVRSTPPAQGRKPRIAVIVPVNYRGGSLSGAKLLAEAIDTGARQAGSPVEVIFGHLDDPDCDTREEFAGLPLSIKRRPYKWHILSREAAHRAMAYAGREQIMDAPAYQVPEDGMKQFMDCDLWVIVSDRLEHPVLPLRPYVLMVYDYLQRYQPLLRQDLNRSFIGAAHLAERIFVTTDFTRQDAIQYAGLPDRQVVRVPMLARRFLDGEHSRERNANRGYFLWTTNLAPHKNHVNALKALDRYYNRLDGKLTCCVSGVGTDQIFKSKLKHLAPLRQLVDNSPNLRRRLQLLGELPDHAYRSTLAGTHFLWHAGWIDNGTFSVVEAAQLGVPSLSSDYPAMREIDAQFALRLAWMNSRDPDDMARQLKHMELHADRLRAGLPSHERLETQSVEQLAAAYWEALSKCL